MVSEDLSEPETESSSFFVRVGHALTLDDPARRALERQVVTRLPGRGRARFHPQGSERGGELSGVSRCPRSPSCFQVSALMRARSHAASRPSATDRAGLPLPRRFLDPATSSTCYQIAVRSHTLHQRSVAAGRPRSLVEEFHLGLREVVVRALWDLDELRSTSTAVTPHVVPWRAGRRRLAWPRSEAQRFRRMKASSEVHRDHGDDRQRELETVLVLWLPIASRNASISPSRSHAGCAQIDRSPARSALRQCTR